MAIVWFTSLVMEIKAARLVPLMINLIVVFIMMNISIVSTDENETVI